MAGSQAPGSPSISREQACRYARSIVRRVNAQWLPQAHCPQRRLQRPRDKAGVRPAGSRSRAGRRRHASVAARGRSERAEAGGVASGVGGQLVVLAAAGCAGGQRARWGSDLGFRRAPRRGADPRGERREAGRVEGRAPLTAGERLIGHRQRVVTGRPQARREERRDVLVDLDGINE